MLRLDLQQKHSLQTTTEQRDDTTSQEIYTFKRDCQIFLATMIGKIQ